MLLLTAGAEAQAPVGAPPAPGATQPPPAVRPTIAVFNMAAVMRDYGQAKYRVWALNKKRNDLSVDLVKWRSEYIKLQQDIQLQQVPAEKDRMQKRMVELARLIEDK